VYDPNVEMKGGNTSAALDRSAASDLWRNTLSQIPSVFGRLVYLASLRNANSGRYEHHGLALIFGEDEANKALKKSHSQLFAEWLAFNVEQQKADLDLYISSLFEDKRTVVETWLKLAPYRNLIPSAVRGVERRLYIADLTALMELLKNAYAVDAPDRDE
jgi:tRNA(Met) C34 N-acetyltransferase TmcA